ncbi:hypothetical protein [Mycobacterium sp.]|uniref:hypothetical protein n=1 Tax=Mycobacterium sp. TaxID=1785 RepID=UPI0031DC4BF8
MSEGAGTRTRRAVNKEDSKDELFCALMAAGGDPLRAHIAAAVAASGGRPDRN